MNPECMLNLVLTVYEDRYVLHDEYVVGKPYTEEFVASVGWAYDDAVHGYVVPRTVMPRSEAKPRGETM